MKSKEIILQANLSQSGKNHFLSERGSEFETAVKNALISDLPRDMREIYGVEIAVEIKAIRYGSLIVFYGVLVAGLSALSRYKNLYDSIELIRKQSSTVLGALKQNYDEFNINISTAYPRLPDPYDRHHSMHHEMFIEELGIPSLPHTRRDAFFYFLLGWSILSLVVIGILVYAAVRKTYFP